MYIQRLAGQQVFFITVNFFMCNRTKDYGYGQPSYVNPDEHWPTKKYSNQTCCSLMYV